MIFDLVKDFADVLEAIPEEHPRRRILKLLDEAIRRDVHFIDRHPTTFFQCMWNTCWWYDCPGIERFRARPADPEPDDEPASQTGDDEVRGAPPQGMLERARWLLGGLMWMATHGTAGAESAGANGSAAVRTEGMVTPAPVEPMLSRLLENWRTAREQQVPGARWIRALRPPVIPLDTALHSILRGHSGRVSSVTISGDGSRLATCGGGWIRIWDRSTGRPLHSFKLPRGVADAVRFSPDGRWLLSSWHEGEFSVWDATSGELQRRVVLGKETLGSRVEWLDDRRIVCTSYARAIHVRDVANGEILTTLERPGVRLDAFAILENGRRVATAANTPQRSDPTHAVWIWDLETGRHLHAFRGGTPPVDDVVAVNGSRIVARRGRTTLEIWDSGASEPVGQLDMETGWVEGIAAFPDGNHLAVALEEGLVEIWDLQQQKRVRTWRAHESIATDVTVSPDGEWVLSGSSDHTARLWRVQADDPPDDWERHTAGITTLAFSHDGRWLASASRDETVRIWDAATGEPIHCLRGHFDQVAAITFSPDSRRIISGADDKTVRIWDVETGEALHCLEPHSGFVRGVAISPDGRWIVSGCRDRYLRISDAATGEPGPQWDNGLRYLAPNPYGMRSPIDCVLFPDDSGRFISIIENEVYVWDVETGGLIEHETSADRMVELTAHANDPLQVHSRVQFAKHALELTLQNRSQTADAGWLGLPLLSLVTHPSGRMWAGQMDYAFTFFPAAGETVWIRPEESSQHRNPHFHLFCLEGEPPAE